MQASDVGRIVGFCAVSLMACSAQVDSGYRGESLGALKLALRADEDEVVPPNTAIGLIWELVDPEGFQQQGDRFGELIDVTEDVPFDVQLDLPQPPPDPLLIEMADGNALAVARIWWMDRVGFDPVQVTGTTYQGYGGAHDNAIVYLAQDVVAGEATSRFLHGTPSAGYHILSVDRPPEIGCWLTGMSDARGFERLSGTCPRNALAVAPEDLNTTVVVTPSPFLRLVYEDIETAW